MNRRLRSPPGVQRGTRKQNRPPAAYARVRKASDMGAEQKNLWPVRRYSAPSPVALPAGSARVELVRTSEPPCFSVMNIPMVAPALSDTGMSRRS